MENNEEMIEYGRFAEGMRVLAVDNSTLCLKVLIALLEKCHYKVHATTKTDEALKLLRENKNSFDLVISSVMMPNMDGFAFSEIINLENNDLPVILLSASDDKKDVIKGMKSGAEHYLLKPPRYDVIKNLWQHVVRRKLLNTKQNAPIIKKDAKLLKNHADNNPEPATPDRQKEGAVTVEERKPEKDAKLVEPIPTEQTHAETASENVEDKPKGSGNIHSPPVQNAEPEAAQEEVLGADKESEHAHPAPLNQKRKVEEKEAGTEEGNAKKKSKQSVALCPQEKPRFRWTDDMHKKFIDVHERLQPKERVPSRIHEEMKEPNLTTKNISSHLQKYREGMRKQKAKIEDSNSDSSRSGTHQQNIPGLQPFPGISRSSNQAMAQPGTYGASVMNLRPKRLPPNHQAIWPRQYQSPQEQLQQGAAHMDTFGQEYTTVRTQRMCAPESIRLDKQRNIQWMQQQFGGGSTQHVFPPKPIYYGNSCEPNLSNPWAITCGPPNPILSSTTPITSSNQKLNSNYVRKEQCPVSSSHSTSATSNDNTRPSNNARTIKYVPPPISSTSASFDGTPSPSGGWGIECPLQSVPPSTSGNFDHPVPLVHQKLGSGDDASGVGTVASGSSSIMPIVNLSPVAMNEERRYVDFNAGDNDYIGALIDIKPLNVQAPDATSMDNPTKADGAFINGCSLIGIDDIAYDFNMFGDMDDASWC